MAREHHARAQRRKFAELLVEGKISPETYEEWNRETGSKKLPDHAKPKKRAKRKTAATPPSAKRYDCFFGWIRTRNARRAVSLGGCVKAHARPFTVTLEIHPPDVDPPVAPAVSS